MSKCPRSHRGIACFQVQRQRTHSSFIRGNEIVVWFGKAHHSTKAAW